MSRQVIESEDAARSDLGKERRQPAWLSGRHALPFQDLSDDEFEVFSYLLLLREEPGGRVIYYGKTGDAGRDVVRISADGGVELIQCKRYTSNVGVGEVRGELAKLCTNVFRKAIPRSPGRVVFYAVPDLTAPAKDLLGARDKWLECCEEALEAHLGKKPPADLATFAKTWWPEFDHEDEHRLTERARKHQGLIDEFFLVRHVVSGSIGDIKPQLSGMAESIKGLQERFEEIAGNGQPTASPSSLKPSVGSVSQGAQALQVRMLAAKVSTLEDRDRQHIDEDGRRLIAEIQGAIRTLDLRHAASAMPRLEGWLAGSGGRASASVRGRIAVLLADLALIEQVESRGTDPVDTAIARRWHMRATEEFDSGASPEDAARLAALESRLLSLEGNPAEAVELAATSHDDPACLGARLSTLIDQERFAEAIQVASDVPLHDRWCDRLVIAHMGLGDTAAAERVTAASRRLFDQLTHRRCLLVLAQSRVQRVLASWLKVQTGLPPDPPEDIARSLRTALDDLRPLLVVAEADERVGNGLEAEAVACAILCERLLGDRGRASSLAALLGTREPVHLEFARSAFRGDIEPPRDLPGRLRRDHPNHFDARLLSAILSVMGDKGDGTAFEDGLVAVSLARTEVEKEQAIGVLLEVVPRDQSESYREAERVADSTLGPGHRLTRCMKAAGLLAARESEEAALLIEALRDEADPVWRQLAATLSLLRDDESEALKHLQAASRDLARTEVLEHTASLAFKLGRYDAAEEALDRLVRLRPDDPRGWRFLASICSRLGRHGRAAWAFAALRRLEPDVLAHGVNHAKALALSGRREEAVRIFDAVCSRHPQSLEAIGGRAHILDILGRPGEALRTLAPIKEVFWSEPTFLILYLSLGYRAGREEEANLALSRLLELKTQGSEVPLWTFTLEELFEEFRARSRAREGRNEEILRGHLPWLTAGRASGQPSLGSWAFRTQELPLTPESPQARAELSIYSTNGWTVGPKLEGDDGRSLRRVDSCPPQGTAVVADLSSLITLQHLGLLDRAASHFGRILIPASYSELALLEQSDYQPHQPTRLEAASEIRDAVDRGRILLTTPEGGPLPLLDEHEDGPAYRLRDVTSWLYEQGHIDEVREREILERLSDRGAHSDLPPVTEVVLRGFQTTVMTLEAAIQAGLLPTLVGAMRLSLSVDDVEEVRERLWASEHQARLAEAHEKFWAAIQQDERFEQAEVEMSTPEGDAPRDRRNASSFDAALLSESRRLPLLVDDRAFQAVILNGRPDDVCPAFGTDCLLVALADSGAIAEGELADAFLRLIRWRYRFLVPPARVLATLAVRHRTHPPGTPLREVSRYVHDCFRDPGLLAGLEATDPPVSVAWESYRYWVQHATRFVVGLWNDERFDERSRREFTAWAFGELLPSPPLALPRIGAAVLCETTAQLVLLTTYGEVWRFKDHDRAAKAVKEVAAALRLTKEEYLEIVGRFLDQLPAGPVPGLDPEAMLEVNGIFAHTALSPVRTVGPRVYFALSRLGVATAPPATPSPDALAAVLDPAHERRVPNPPGPIVLLRGNGDGRAGEAICIPDFVLHPALTARRTAVSYLKGAPDGPSSWLSPSSKASLAEATPAILSEVAEEWLPAARELLRILEVDYLLNLAAFRQCCEANLQAEQVAYWRRVIRPGLSLTASVPVDWYDVPSNGASSAKDEAIDADGTALSLALDRYFLRYGHLPLAPPATAGSVVRRWAEASGRGAEAWDAVWRWADEGASPLRIYHACQVFLECPDLVPGGQSPAFWERARSLNAQGGVDGDGQSEAAPDLRKIGWELRRDLARHYLGQLELHAPPQQTDRLAALAWWAAERVAAELAATPLADGVDTAPALQNVLDRMVRPEAELTEVEWNVLRPAGAVSIFSFGTMEARNLWAASLFSGVGPGLELTPEDEPWVTINLLSASMGGFPPPGVPPGSDRLAFANTFDDAAGEWARRIATEENRTFLLEVLDLRKEIAEPDGLLRLVREAPGSKPHRQPVVCNAFRSLAALGAVAEADAWGLLADSKWLRHAAACLEPAPLQRLVGGFLEVQRREGGRWHWTLPHLLASLADELDVPPERRRLLAFASVRSAAIGGGMCSVRSLLSGSHREELGPLIDEWREQFVVVRTSAPPLAAAYLRGVTAGLAR